MPAALGSCGLLSLSIPAALLLPCSGFRKFPPWPKNMSLGLIFLVAEDAPDLGDVTAQRPSLPSHGVSSAVGPADSSSLKTSLTEGCFWISAPASTSACLYQDESLRGEPLCLFSLTISSSSL